MAFAIEYLSLSDDDNLSFRRYVSMKFDEFLIFSTLSTSFLQFAAFDVELENVQKYGFEISDGAWSASGASLNFQACWVENN